MRFLGIIFVSAMLTIAFGIYSEAAMRSGPLVGAAIPAANDRTFGVVAGAKPPK